MTEPQKTSRALSLGGVGAVLAGIAALLALAEALRANPIASSPLRVAVLVGGALALALGWGRRRALGWRVFLALTGLAILTYSYAGFWGPTLGEEAPGARLLCEFGAASLALVVFLPSVWRRGALLPVAIVLILLTAVNGYLLRVWSSGGLPQVVSLALVPTLLIGGVGALWRVPLGRPVLLLWGTAAIATLFAPDPGSALTGWLGLSVAVGVFGLVAELRRGGLSRRTGLLVLLGPSVVVFALTAARMLILAARIGTPEALGARLGAIGLNPNVLSSYLVLILPGWLGMAVAAGTRRARVFSGAMLAVGTLLLLLTLSKGGWLGWGVGSGVFLVLVLKRRWRVLLLGAAIGLSVIGAVLMARGAQRDSLSRRVLTWRAAGQAVAHRPIVGAGLLNNHVHRAFLRPEDGERITTSEEWDLLLGHSHNLLLQVGEGLGFLGIALMGWLVVSAVLSGRAAWVVSGAGGRPVVAGILGGLAGHLATSMFLVGYSTPTLLAVEAAALLALLSDGGERTRSRGRMLLIPLGLLVLLLTRGETHRLAAEQARRHDNIAGLLSEAKAWASVSPWAASPRAEVGRTFLREGQLDEAAEWLAAAVARSKLYAPYRVSLAEAYRRQGRWLDAMRELEAAVELDPAYTQPQGGLAARVELQSLNKARGDDGALRTVGPMGERGEREARLATATALLESGKKAAAMAILQTLLKESQSDVERYRAAMLLASAQERLRRPGQAMQTYRLAASINDGPEPREAMGRLHLDAGRVSRAVKELELAVAAGAGSDAHARLAQALEMSGDLNRGLWAAREAVRLSPTSGRARSMLGRLLFLSGAAGRAVAELEAAARLDTLSAKPLVLLAEVHRKEKDLAKALQAASDAVAREPELPWAHKQKAFTLQGMGRNEEAVAAWREAVRLDTGDTEAHYFLALALEGTGATAEMREELLLYLEMEPDGRWAERAQDLLGSGG